MNPARNLHDVVRDIDELIEYSRRTEWRIGYFAALYHHVAKAFVKAMEKGAWQHPDLMERLDVVFFDRFLAAVDQHRHGAAPTAPWAVAFDAAGRRGPTVLQHLLLGMNAHINFDLGIAVAHACPPERMAEFEPDFVKMNGLLASLLGVVEDDLSRIWPWLGWLHRVLGRVEDGIINFSMRVGRRSAWELAVHLSQETGTARHQEVTERGKEVAWLGRKIARPPIPASVIFAILRLEQRGSVPHIIDILLGDRLRARLDGAADSYLAEG